MAGPYTCLYEDPATGALIVDNGIFHTETDPCEYVVITGAQSEDLGGSLPPLDATDASLIAAAIGGLWFFGWWIRQLIKQAQTA